MTGPDTPALPFIVRRHHVVQSQPPGMARWARLDLALMDALGAAYEPVHSHVQVTDDYGTLWAQFGALWQVTR